MASTAVASLARILDQTLQHQRLILHNRQEIESLLQEVSSLQVSLQNDNSESIKSLESLITNAAYKALDLIESHILELLIGENNIVLSCRGFQELVRGIIFIERRVDEEENELMKIVREVYYDFNEFRLHPTISSEFRVRTLQFDFQLVWERVCGFVSTKKLETVSIVGIAGIGKTTLVRRLYNSSVSSIESFDTYAWVTISQSYYLRQTIIDFLDSLKRFTTVMHKQSTAQLGEYLYESLKGRKYLIVLDNVHDTKVWDDLSQLFPNDYNTSRILLTTRLENVAVHTDSSRRPHRMDAVQHMLARQYEILRNRRGAESLLKRVCLLQDVVEISLQVRSNVKLKYLKNQIINVAKNAKDFTESGFMDYNLTFSRQCLEKVKGEIDSVKQMVMRIEEASSAQDLHLRICAPGVGSSKSAAASGEIPVVGLNGDFMEIKNRLAGESSKLQVVSLVGMGGIGKTTLAREVINDKYFLEYFHIRAWVTISQVYNLRQILISLLDSMETYTTKMHKWSTEQLKEYLYKSLKGRRYLIVLDDVWDTKLWDDLRQLFPNDKNSSRILLTTRLENVAVYANSCLHHMHFLNEDGSWNLFCNRVFGENYCPPELEAIGKKIVKNCRGLPLSVIVIGGLLSKATRMQHYWRNIAENLSSVIISNDEHSSNVISLSYAGLPDHLKECFLYTGIFPEDFNISVSKLVKLWIAERYVEPVKSKSFEDVAYEYLLDLVSRSLILVDKLSSLGKIKTCKVHDIVRDFCTREAKKEMHFHVSDRSLYGIPVGASVRLLSIHPNTSYIFPWDDKKLSSLLVSSLSIFDPDFDDLQHCINPRPLKVLDVERAYYLSGFELEVKERKNLQYFDVSSGDTRASISSDSMLQNLQNLSIYSMEAAMNLPQVRHVKGEAICLHDPLGRENSFIVLENLQTLSQVNNFKCSKEVVHRIPNLKKLGVSYGVHKMGWQYYCLENLVFLHKLEAFTFCQYDAFSLPETSPRFLHFVTFPPSLRKLTLEDWILTWKDMVIVASLPNLEVLKLKLESPIHQEWESTEDQFLKLKFLLLEYPGLKLWRADSINFPSLQHLIIRRCRKLDVIPCSIGEIPTLQLIVLHACADSLIDSVKEMQKEQLDFGNDSLQVRIYK